MKKFISIFILSLLVGCSANADDEKRGYVDDATIAAQILDSFFHSPDLSLLDLKIHVYKGDVEVCGFVENTKQIQKILMFTHAIEGVRNVYHGVSIQKNSSTVQSMKDALLAAKVKNALISCQNMPVSQISVSVENEVVQLCGFVASNAVITEASQLLQRIKEIKGIENRLIKVSN